MHGYCFALPVAPQDRNSPRPPGRPCFRAWMALPSPLLDSLRRRDGTSLEICFPLRQGRISVLYRHRLEGLGSGHEGKVRRVRRVRPRKPARFDALYCASLRFCPATAPHAAIEVQVMRLCDGYTKSRCPKVRLVAKTFQTLEPRFPQCAY